MRVATQFTIFWLATACAISCGAARAWADDAATSSEAANSENDRSSFMLEDDYALGVSRFDVDTHTEVIGWRLSRSMFFGHQDGEDSGLSLVWQDDMNQISLSKDGLRLTRRF